MADGVSDQLWARSLSGLQPKTVLNHLRARLSRSEAFQSTLADLFKQRAAAESEYVLSLQKISKKFGEAGSPAGEKGEGVVKIWEMVLSDLNDTASQHSQLSTLIKSEYEQPIRDMPSKIGSWSRIGVQDSNVEKTIKAFEAAQSKVQKLSKKGGPKLTIAQSDLSSATSDLQIQSPSLYAAYQQVDRERLEKLKEIALKWQTGKSDRGQRMLQAAETGTMSVLGWEVDDDLRGVVRKLGGRLGAEEETSGWAGDSDNASQRGGTPARPSSNSRQASTDFQPSPSSISTHRNGSTDASSNLPPSSSLSSTLKSKFSRKNSVAGNTGGFMSGGRDRSNSGATLKSNVNGKTGMMAGSGGAFETLSDMRQGGARGPSFDAPRTSGGASVSGDAPTVDADGFSVPPPNRERAPWESSGGRDLMDEDNEGDSISALPSPSLHSATAPRLNMSLAPAPIQESEAEQSAALQKVQASLLAAPPSGGNAPNRRSTLGGRGRRDVRNTMFAGAPDDMPLAQAMKMYGPEGGVPEESERTESPTALASPIATMGSVNGVESRPGGVGRQMSAMSSVSSNNPFDARPAALGGSGLRASITESVNVTSKDGKATKVLVTGEINLTLRDLANFAPAGSSGPVHIRLEQFEQLEKVAPNPKFLAQVPNKPGEYFLNAETLATVTSSQAAPPILFKYQVYIPDDKISTFAPIEFNPEWKNIPGETRLRLSYSVNKSSTLALGAGSTSDSSPFGDSGSSKLTDITFIAGLGGAIVKNVQAKPVGGKWSGERKKMMWKVDDLELGSGLGEGKIVARFLTEGEDEGVPEGVSVKFRYEGGALGSGLGLSVVDDDGREGGWKFEEVKKVVVSGTYATE